MWGLSMNLCLPYASVFMLAVGLNDVEIGAVASVYMFMQVIFAFLSGPIIDKLGRRLSTAIFDFVAWCVPCVIWMLASDFRHFLVAALFNGVMKVTTNSWDCLLVEDAEKSQITRLYSLVIICGHMSALFAPISSVLVSRLTLVPAIRILYANAFVVMTAKIAVLYRFSTETATGAARRRETQGQSLLSLLRGYGRIARLMARSRGTLYALAISSLVGIVGMVNTTFWQILVSKKLGVPDSALPFFPMLRSLIALAFFFTVIARISQLRLRNPTLLGFASYLCGQALLVLAPAGGFLRYPMLCVSLLFDGFAVGMLAMLAESLVAIHVDAAERARVLALMQMSIMFISAPFGWIAGILSDMSRDLPFAMNLALIAGGIALTAAFYRGGRGAWDSPGRDSG
jgi:MFS family permease